MKPNQESFQGKPDPNAKYINKYIGFNLGDNVMKPNSEKIHMNIDNMSKENLIQEVYSLTTQIASLKAEKAELVKEIELLRCYVPVDIIRDIKTVLTKSKGTV